MLIREMQHERRPHQQRQVAERKAAAWGKEKKNLRVSCIVNTLEGSFSNVDCKPF